MLQINILDRTLKRCTGCGDQPRDAFTVHRGRADGLTDRCKACRKRQRAEYYVNNKASIRAKNDARVTANPEKKRAADRRYHAEHREEHLARFTAYRAAHREHLNAADRAYYAANHTVRRAANRLYAITMSPETRARQTEAKRAWAAKHPDRIDEFHRRRSERKARTTLHTFSKEDVEMRAAVFGYRCAYCTKPWMHMDHVKPLARGGPHCLANLRPTCAACNWKKGVQHHIVWLRRQITANPSPLPLP